MSAPLSPDALRDDLRRNAFALDRPTGGPPRIGAEVELIPVATDTRRPVPIHPLEEDGLATLPVLRAFGAENGWREQPSPYGAPTFALPDGGCISYEPGGQVELSAAVCASAGALRAALRGTVQPLVAFAREHGIELLSVGIEPLGSIEDLPLQLPGKRYVRLTRFLESIGTGGTRMMRQTAAMQISLDWGRDPLVTWRLLNALAPYVIAVFANSPVHRGRETGHRSYRARVWRELDGGRTGLFGAAPDPVAEYRDFALAAPAILLPEREGEGDWRPFAEWNAVGRATLADWQAHLTTLFPEIRPKGWVEVRSPDAVAPEWYAAPLVLLGGLVYDAQAERAALDLLGAPDEDVLERAGRLGLGDESIAATARDLWEIALEGAAANEGFYGGEALGEARAFFDRFTRVSRSPADEVAPARDLAPA